MWPKETVAHKVFTHKHVPPFGGGEPLKAVGDGYEVDLFSAAVFFS
jgi:hypothetical protein